MPADDLADAANMPHVPVAGGIDLFDLEENVSSDMRALPAGLHWRDVMEVNRISDSGNERRIALDQLLDEIGWGFLLITIGILWLMPDGQVPRGSGLIAVGLIMLGLNAARYSARIKMNGFTLVVGLLAVLAGTATFLSVDLPLFPIALIVVGVCLLLVPEIEDRSVSHACEDWRCCR